MHNAYFESFNISEVLMDILKALVAQVFFLVFLYVVKTRGRDSKIIFILTEKIESTCRELWWRRWRRWSIIAY